MEYVRVCTLCMEHSVAAVDPGRDQTGGSKLGHAAGSTRVTVVAVTNTPARQDIDLHQRKTYCTVRRVAHRRRPRSPFTDGIIDVADSQWERDHPRRRRRRGTAVLAACAAAGNA